MAKRIGILFLAFSVAISACGTVKGDAPGRAGAPAVTPYDGTHLDAGNVDNGGGIGDAGSAFDISGGPQLVP